MTILITVGSNAELRARCARQATNVGLRHLSFAGEEDGLAYLVTDAPCGVLCIGQSLATGDAIRLLQSVRLEVQRITLPIIFVLDSDNADGQASAALQAGATEVIRQSESAAMTEFLARHVSARNAPIMNGHVLLVEDTNSEAIFVTKLCNAMGLEVDRGVSADQAEALLENNRYDIIVVDVILEGIRSGISLLRSIRQRERGLDHVPVLMMSAYDDSSRRIDILRSGADDFIGKPFAPEEFVWRLRRLLENHGLAETTQGLRSAMPGNVGQETLTAREKEICHALAEGLGDKQIATALGISYWTVRSHVQSVFRKLNVVNRRELMVRLSDHPQQ